METQLQSPLLSVTITSAFPGYQRSMRYQNGTWSGHNLTHHFNDDRASISHSSTNGGLPQNRPPRKFAALTLPQQPLPPQAGLPAGSSASSSHLPIPPDMSGRPITEQAILAALQAMATNPDYSDFMRTMEQHWPGLRTITLPHVTIPEYPYTFSCLYSSCQCSHRSTRSSSIQYI